MLRKRAELMRSVREFFFTQDVLEVETPSLYPFPATDPHQQCFEVPCPELGAAAVRYLQPSPEYAMKRLLAAGSGSIYQICKAFRRGEAGSRHNPEFTMLEWYRVGFDYVALMNEVDALLRILLDTETADRVTYGELFQSTIGIDPFSASLDDVRETTRCLVDYTFVDQAGRDECLDVLVSHVIEPQLGLERPVFVTDYPASQASLARVRPAQPPVAERFELYYQGIELANGFHELLDAEEQQQRFQTDVAVREKNGQSPVPVDHLLLAALASGLPACSGVALGLDRLLMIACGANRIDDVLAFPWR